MNPLALILVLLLVLALPVGAQTSGRSAGLTLHVSPQGKDTWTGRLKAPARGGLEGPLATVAGAQKAVQAARAAGHRGPVTVLLSGGTYQLPAPLTFGPADGGAATAPVTYAGAPGETVVLSGGLPLTGWQRDEGALWSVEIPEVKAGQLYFHQLFINGERRTRARTPDEGYLRTAGPAVPLGDRQAARSNTQTKISFRYEPDDLRLFDEWEDVNLIVYHAWTASRHWIKSLDEAQKIVEFRAPSGWPMGYWEAKQRYVIENCREALTRPGEWYLSRREGKLYYWPLPGEDLRRVRAVAPRLQHLLLLRGEPALGLPLSHLTFRNLSFQYADWRHAPDKMCDGQAAVHLTAAVVATGVTDSVWENCEIARGGEYGLILGNGCKRNRVVQCHIHNLGGGGVRLGETALPNDQTQQAEYNTLDNCFIHDGGHVFAGAIGVWIGRSSYNTVRHNEICDFLYSGCSVGWSWGYAPTTAHHNVFEYNHIHHIGQGVLSDMGGIYSLGISPGTVERYNLIHDVYSYSYGGWGLYTDEGSSDILLENNVVYNTKSGGFHQHYGENNVIRNNVFAFAWEANIMSSRSDIPNSLTFEGNIVLTDNGEPLGGALGKEKFTLRRNLYWDVAGNELEFYGEEFADWQAKDQDEGSVVADPRCRNPKAYDFTLLPGSPALKLGFKPIDLSRVGLYGDPAWRALPAKVKRPANPPRPERKTTLVVDDFETTAAGDPPTGARVSGEENGAGIRVTADTAASGKHSLRFTDAEGLSHEWQPHMYYEPRQRRGVVQFAWSLRRQPQAIVWHEWRDRNSPYLVGPSLRVEANGELKVGDRVLCQLPAGQWVRLQLTCPVGKQSTGRWNLTVTRPGAEPQTFEDLPCASPKFRQLEWLGFISLATQKTVFEIDDLKMAVEK